MREKGRDEGKGVGMRERGGIGERGAMGEKGGMREKGRLLPILSACSHTATI